MSPKKCKQAILFLSNKSEKWIFERFEKLKQASSSSIDVFFLFHQQNHLPERIRKENHFTFSSNILSELGYNPIKKTLLPGSNHFPLLDFFLRKDDYDFYWVVEDDVCFNGNWGYFFSECLSKPADFLSAYIELYQENPEWYWWDSLSSSIPVEDFDKVKSFNPIYRLSKEALSCIDHALKNGWSGHHEVLIPTLLRKNGFSLMDFGGTGTFTLPDDVNRFYTKDTLSHLPLELGNKHNYIYHPIKGEKRIMNPNSLKEYCVISAVGKNSLHRKWLQKESNFDLHLIIYDDSYGLFSNDTDFITCQRGYKLKLVYNYLLHNPTYLNQYRYFFIPDDDIEMESSEISKLFALMKQYDLRIAQPALRDSYYTFEHTLYDKFCTLRYTNFVEMMLPCFSRNALIQVLQTFNENNTGWGIEYHWPYLIGYTGKEMAIIDEVKAIHTRPIGSYNILNENELKEYLKKYNLIANITENGYIPGKTEHSKRNIQIIKRDDFLPIKECLNSIVNTILFQLNNTNDTPLGLSGLTGVSLFFVNYYRLTGKRIFLDKALEIAAWVNGNVGTMKNDLSISSGLPGFSWYIEYLAQQGFIENTTDDILFEICEFYNDCYCSKISKLNEKEKLLGLATHLLTRTYNSNFDLSKKINQTEKNILTQVIDSIDSWTDSFMQNREDTNPNEITNFILFLCFAYRTISDPLIETILRKLVNILSNLKFLERDPIMLKYYAMLLSFKILNDTDSQKNIIYKMKFLYKKSEHDEMVNKLFLLGNFIREDQYEIFKEEFILTPDFSVMQKMIQRTSDIGIYGGLSGIGLSLLSLLSENNMDIDMIYLKE